MHSEGAKFRFLKSSRLESKVAAAMIGLCLITAIFFLSHNITGNVVVNLAPKTLNIIGAISFVIGIMGIFYYFKINQS